MKRHFYKILVVGIFLSKQGKAQRPFYFASGTRATVAVQATVSGNKWVGIWGQSNGEGLSPRSYLWTGGGHSLTPLPTRTFSRVFIYNLNTDSFEPLQVGAVGTLGLGGGNEMGEQGAQHPPTYEDGFGPEIGLAQRFEQETLPTDSLFITKFGFGGSSINNWLKIGGGYWGLFERRYDSSASILSTRHPGLQMTSMLWDQGEGDAGMDQATYQSKLTQLIADARSEFLSASGIYTVVLKGAAGVRAAQLAVDAADPLVKTYDSVPYSKFDGTHYTGDEQLRSGGRDFFNAVFGTTGTINGL